MRVLLLIDNLGSGGAQRQMVNLALGLTSRGHTVTLLHYTPGDHFRERLAGSPVVVRDAAKTWRFDPMVVWRIRRVLEAATPDVSLSFLRTPNTYNLLAGAGLGRRWKTVVSERSFDPPGRMRPGVFALRQLYRGADAVVFNSHHQRLRLEAALPWVRERSLTIYNGVDLDEFRPTDHRPTASHIRLLAVGSVSACKNGLLLIQALALLRHTYGIDARVQWVGQVVHSLADRHAYYLRMVEAVQKANLGDAWAWVAPQPDLHALLCESDALVLPSLGEGLPNVVCEALACGVPVLASDCLDHPLLVRSGETGFLFDPRDAQGLVTAVRQLAELSEGQRARMAHAARTFAERNLSLSRMVDSYESLFTQVVNRVDGTA